ncbi:MAG: 23S rRNA pseudouridine(955/2504/2580) synthase RluC [Gammaproteobacteria bacterium]|nr:MAG: 23S rRNA pseudouridine(955/2504/2580) synthase RluC [Gammaproteobacteria bacterium]
MVEIDADHEGQRLDNFLMTQLKGVPRSRIYRIVRKGEVRINKGRQKPDYKLQCGDKVRIPPIRVAARPAINENADFQWLEQAVLHEDSKLMVLNKPTGLAVHGGSGVSLGLIEALRRLRPQCRFLELVHRLDRDTSGCLLVAKKRSILLALHKALREGNIDKRYVALCRGGWQGKGQTVEAPLLRYHLANGERRVRVHSDGKPAKTRFSLRRSLKGAVLLDIKLFTGRTHQARVHAAHINHPIAGDDKYGDKAFNQAMKKAGLKRMALHAERLRFQHPGTNEWMMQTAPMPDEMNTIVETLAI